MNATEREKIDGIRLQGNTHFKAGELLEAHSFYSKAVELVTNAGSLTSKSDSLSCI